jgi:hypothetical protein
LVHPEIKNEFPKFKNVDLANLEKNKDFRAHAKKIYHVIDDAVMKENWNSVENLSRFHKNLGKTNRDHFNKFREVFVDFVTLQNDGHRSGTDAWNTWFDEFLQHFFRYF